MYDWMFGWLIDWLKEVCIKIRKRLFILLLGKNFIKKMFRIFTSTKKKEEENKKMKRLIETKKGKWRRLGINVYLQCDQRCCSSILII